MGVIAVTDIDYGQIFGPFPSYLTSADPAYVIGLLTNDKHPDSVILKIDTNDWRERMGAVDWLPYVASARDEEEQNMEAYPKEGCIFYRTLRIVRAGEELLVWYSKDFTQILAVPELNTNSKRNDEQFICTHCGEMFEFPFPLRAHLKFKCTFASEENLYSQKTNVPQLSPGSFPSNKIINCDVNVKDNKIIPYSQNNNIKVSSNNSKVLSPFPFNKRKRHSDDDEDGDKNGATNPPPPKVKTPTPQTITDKTTTKRDSFTSYSIENLSKSHVKSTTKPINEDEANESKSNIHHQISNLNENDHPDRENSNTPPPSIQQIENISAFRKVEKTPNFNNTSLNFSDAQASPMSSTSSINSSSSSTPPLSKPDTPPKMRKQSPTPTVSDFSTTNHYMNSRIFGHNRDIMHHPSHKESLHASLQPSTSSSFLHPSKRPIKTIMPPASSGDKASYSPMVSASLMNMYMPRLPILSPQASPLRLPPTAVPSLLAQTTSGSMSTSVGGRGGNGSSGLPIPVPVSVPHSAFPASDQIPPGLLEMCRATIPTVGPLTESFAANIRNGNIQATLNKQALFADRHISSLNFLKSTNPMVEKLLQTTNPTLLSSPINAMNLSQNWCAKCNATFRMTSDLVYHMRSHHKREFDPMKKKREEKLRCTICNETFRERHHLTRHMSSHA